jgi:hypothetical protein
MQSNLLGSGEKEDSDEFIVILTAIIRWIIAIKVFTLDVHS